MLIKVFVENESGSDKKNIFDEKTLKYKKTVTVSKKYPFPYGFILNTTGEDGDNLDCFILTFKKLKTGEIVECRPIGMMEQFETSWKEEKQGIDEADHNVLASIGDEKVEINDEIKNILSDFILNVFKHLPNKKVRAGNFLDEVSAIEYIEKHKS
ncbi:inorganic diphosphatase [Patescibacteria group bacterium]|nr:inorganic diphosphatase [Patescibacteria group bacterium]